MIGPMSDVRHCPSCGDQFRPGIEDCPDCGVALLDAAAATGTEAGTVAPTDGGSAPAAVGAADADAEGTADAGPARAPAAPAAPHGAPVVLDLHPLSDAERRLVGQVVTSRRLRHHWQGANLVVPAHLEAEAEAAVAAALQAARPDLADAGPTVVYEVADWPPEVQTRLAGLLDAAGIAHQWDAGGDLVVAEADEDRVEALFDEIDESELAAGPDPLPVLEALHEDLARLARDPLDGRARRGVAERAGDLAAASLPFGFDARVWRSLVGSVEAFADDLGDLDPPEVRDRAAALREDLRSWL